MNRRSPVSHRRGGPDDRLDRARTGTVAEPTPPPPAPDDPNHAGQATMQSMEPGRAKKSGSGKAESQLRKGVLEYCVLGLLRTGPRYGVELLDDLSAVHVMTTSQGTIYPLLARLRREGLVHTDWQESPNGPPRRYYELTERGHAALEEFTTLWPHFRDAVDRFVTEPPTTRPTPPGEPR